MSIIRRIISSTIIIAVFSYLLLELSNNSETLTKIDWYGNAGKLMLHVGGLLLMQVLMCIGWRSILNAHNVVLDNKSLYYSFYLPNLGKYLPGKVLFLAGRVELSYCFGVSRAVGLSTFFFENLFVVVAAAVFIPASLFMLLKIPGKTQILSYLLLMAVIFWLTTRTEWFLSLFDKLLLKLKQTPLAIHLNASLSRHILGFYIVIWSVYGCACALLAMSIANPGWNYFFPIAAAFIVSWLAGFLSIITPGGLGVREGVLILLLHPILDNTSLMLLAIVARLTWSLAELGMSSIALLLPVELSRQKNISAAISVK